MGRFFSPDSGLNRVLGTLADIMILNLLFLLCCLPLITIGASLTAMYSVALKIAAKKSDGVVKPFFRAFKGSFLKATAIWFIDLMAAVAIYIGLTVVNSMGLPWFFNLIYGIVTLILLFSMTWCWALEAQFANTIGGTLKNSAVLAFAHPLKTIAAIILNLLPLAVLVLFGGEVFAQLGFLWFLFVFSGAAILNSMMFGKVFDGLIRRQEESAAAAAIGQTEEDRTEADKTLSCSPEKEDA